MVVPSRGGPPFNLLYASINTPTTQSTGVPRSSCTGQELLRQPVLAARSWRVIGVTRYIEGDLAQALYAYSLALPLFEKTGESTHQAAIQALIAEAFHRPGNIDQAWRHIGAALDLLVLVQDPISRQVVLEEAASSALEIGHPDVALIFQNEILAVLRDAKDWPAVAHALHQRAQFLAEAGAQEEALQNLEESKRYAALIEDAKIRQVVEEDILLKEGRVLRFLDPARSAEVLSRAIESSERTRNFQRLPDLRFERALAYVAIRQMTRHRKISRRPSQRSRASGQRSRRSPCG